MTAAGAAKRHRMLRVIHQRKAPMTVRALCKAMGYNSTSSCWAQAEQLEAQGLLRHVTGYELTEEGRRAVEDGLRGGPASAGTE